MTDSDSSTSTDVSTDAVSTDYKVLGKFTDKTGSAVLGINDSDTEDPIGVEGRSSAPNGYGLATPDDANVTGNLDTAGEFRVNVDDREMFRIDGQSSSGKSGNVVAGNVNNQVGTNVFGATVGGGGFDTRQSGEKNQVFDHHGTVSGGADNTAGSSDGDPTTAQYASVVGGYKNKATASYAAVWGGEENEASRPWSAAGGRKADANHEGAIVIGDSTTTSISSSSADEMRVQQDFYANSLNQRSARAEKHDVGPVDPESVLEGVEDLPVHTWSYDQDAERGEDDDAPTHMGPMAGEFHDAFGLGDDEETIATVDSDGVALAAIKGLAERLDDRDERIEELEAENEELRERIEAVEDRLDAASAAGN